MVILDKKGDADFVCPACVDCDHYTYECDSRSGVDRCMRLQTKKRNCVGGYDEYEGKTLSCNSERRRSLTWRERIFGENKDKCGRTGRYFKAAGKAGL